MLHHSLLCLLFLLILQVLHDVVWSCKWSENTRCLRDLIIGVIELGLDSVIHLGDFELKFIFVQLTCLLPIQARGSRCSYQLG